MDPDQLASLVNKVDQSRPLLKWPADQDPHCFQCKIELVIINQNMNSTGPKGGPGGARAPPPPKRPVSALKTHYMILRVNLWEKLLI